MRHVPTAAMAAALAALLAPPADARPASHEPPRLAAMASRFRGLGYAVTVLPRDSKQPYVGGILVRSIDADTLRSFDVAVYRFRSPADAKAHRQALVASFGRFPRSNQSQLEGYDLFVGATASTILHCTFSTSGKPRCKPFTFPHGRFETVVAVAEGG